MFGGKLNSSKNAFPVFLHCKSKVLYPGIEGGPPRCESGFHPDD